MNKKLYIRHQTHPFAYSLCRADLYRQFRDAGYRAEHALKAAAVLAQFRDEEASERVRLRIKPEFDNYFDVYGEPDSEKERRAIVDAIERNGCYVVISQYLDEASGEWEAADSIGMCIFASPTDPFENPYVVDLMESALTKLPREVLP